MKNILLDDVEYKIEETKLGKWRRFGYPNGQIFEEFASHLKIGGLPLLHYTRGKCPETGKLVVAKGIIAIGRLAMGVMAIGHASAGVVALGQLAIGLVFGLGQASTGLIAIGQLAIAIIFGFGQIATGYVVIAQFGLGIYVLAQFGVGQFVWDTHATSEIAQEFFKKVLTFYRL